MDLIVRPDYQGRGIGSRILQELVERCRARGKAGFYERHGFAARPADAPGMQLKP